MLVVVTEVGTPAGKILCNGCYHSLAYAYQPYHSKQYSWGVQILITCFRAYGSLLVRILTYVLSCKTNTCQFPWNWCSSSCVIQRWLWTVHYVLLHRFRNESYILVYSPVYLVLGVLSDISFVMFNRFIKQAYDMLQCVNTFNNIHFKITEMDTH